MHYLESHGINSSDSPPKRGNPVPASPVLVVFFYQYTEQFCVTDRWGLQSDLAKSINIFDSLLTPSMRYSALSGPASSCSSQRILIVRPMPTRSFRCHGAVLIGRRSTEEALNSFFQASNLSLSCRIFCL
jgi:hypothetical protein